MGGTTTALSIPYPTGTDRVADGDNAMQALAERVEARMPWGVVGYAKVTADMGAVASIGDLPGLSVTFTAVTGRYYKVTGVFYLKSTEGSANERGAMLIKQGGSSIQSIAFQHYTANIDLKYHGEVVISGTASGSTTVNLAGGRSGGIGNYNIVAGAGHPAYILVEDMGTGP